MENDKRWWLRVWQKPKIVLKIVLFKNIVWKSWIERIRWRAVEIIITFSLLVKIFLDDRACLASHSHHHHHHQRIILLHIFHLSSPPKCSLFFIFIFTSLIYLSPHIEKVLPFTMLGLPLGVLKFKNRWNHHPAVLYTLLILLKCVTFSPFKLIFINKSKTT